MSLCFLKRFSKPPAELSNSLVLILEIRMCRLEANEKSHRLNSIIDCDKNGTGIDCKSIAKAGTPANHMARKSRCHEVGVRWDCERFESSKGILIQAMQRFDWPRDLQRPQISRAEFCLGV